MYGYSWKTVVNEFHTIVELLERSYNQENNKHIRPCHTNGWWKFKSLKLEEPLPFMVEGQVLIYW